MTRVPREVFDTGTGPPASRLRSFRSVTRAIFDAWPLGDAAAFRVRSIGHRVGPLIFNQVEFSPLKCRRSARHLGRPNADFLVLEHQLSGEQHVVMPSSEARMLPGRIYLRDWSVGFESFATRRRMNSILIPRQLLPSSRSLGARQAVLSWQASDPTGRLLAHLWAEVMSDFEHVTLAEAERMSSGFLGFLDALISHGERETYPTSLAAMQQFLNDRLQADVGVHDLCTRFRVSRSTVFRMFKPVGGVERYLSRTRLERCYEDLCRASPTHNRIANIARAWGFTEATSFSRAFRKQFGHPPSSVLGREAEPHAARGEAGTGLRRGADSTYGKWFDEAVSSVAAGGPSGLE